MHEMSIVKHKNDERHEIKNVKRVYGNKGGKKKKTRD